MKHLLFILLIPVNMYSQNLDNHTLIIGVITKDAIYLGADSKVGRVKTKMYNNVIVGTSTTYDTVCKIHIAGSIAFGVSGIRVKEITAAINKNFKNKKPFSINLSSFEKMINDTLTEIADEIRRNDPAHYKESFYRNGRLFAEVMIATFLNATPIIYLMEFYASESIADKVQISVKITPKHKMDGSQSMYAIGHFSSFQDSEQLNRIFLIQDIPKRITELVKLQARYTPETVGEPVSVIKVQNNKIIWSNKGRCQ